MAFDWRTAAESRPVLVMGVVNTAPDSFSDGGQFTDPEAAVAHGARLEAQGADVVDVGGESTRPGSQRISVDEELSRVVPVVERLAEKLRISISVDTSKAEVAEAALQAGARMVNDVTALRGDSRMAEVVRRYDAGLVLMHMLGTPATMQDDPCYEDVVRQVRQFLGERLQVALNAEIPPERIVLDPGIGFGKTVEHNLELIRRIGELRELGQPVLVGPSRKRFIGEVLDLPVNERVEGTLAACTVAVVQGADAVRVHDVGPVRRAVDMAVRLRVKGGVS
ncbi:MAG: dihydropteroate synthase [Candidatus Bipolaricaulota bacterium]